MWQLIFYIFADPKKINLLLNKMPYFKITLLYIISIFLFTVKGYGQNNSRKLLGSEINLINVDELNPKITPDGKRIYFTRSAYTENIGGDKAGQDVWFAEKDVNGNFTKALNVGKPINNIEHNSLAGFNADASKAYCCNVYGTVKQGISVSVVDGIKFSKPTDVFADKEISENGFLSFYVTPNEKIMLLSMFTDPVHNEDLFVSFKLDGGWTKPKTLGKTINTNGLELSPFLSNDGKKIFYASNGLGGFGDEDIFVSERLDDSWTNWTKPRNLGNKINTIGFDAYFIADTSFVTAYFCSGEDAKSSSDIYTIAIADIDELNKKMDTIRLETNVNKTIYGTISNLLKKENYIFFSGAKSFNTSSILEVTEQADFLDYIPQRKFFGYDTMRVEVCTNNKKEKCDSLILIVQVLRTSMSVQNVVIDATTQKPLAAAIILNNDTLIKPPAITSTIPFEFSCELKQFRKNKVTVWQKGYFPAVLNIDVTDSVNSFNFVNKVELKPLEVGGTIGLSNIFFETGKSIIKQESFDELDNLANALLRNISMKIYITGHTDNKGSDAANLKLSDERVKSVIGYLIDKKIDKSRLSGKGYGSKKPIATNDTEEGRFKNRRVEFTVEKL